MATASGASTDRPLWQWTATEVAAATRAGQVSCREVVTAVVARLRAANPRLNAVTLDLGDEALVAAGALDEARVAGRATGPLHGVPITIKDNVDVRGQRTPNGLVGLAGLIAPDDSPVVRHLVAAGAVIIGRTNTPEFSMRATTNNRLYGLTRNPWDERISCGGSSGGAGAAVAAGIGAIGHGNDIGGSVRFPALHCGVAGLKPTQGRIPAFLPSATVERATLSALMSVQGPLARSVADLRLALGAMAARDARDPWWVPAPLEGPAAPRRVGLIETVPGQLIAPSVAEALAIAARALGAAGYEVEPITPPSLDASRDLAMRLLFTDIRHQMMPLVERFGSDEIRWYFDTLFGTISPFEDVGEYLEGLAARSILLRDWLALLEHHPVVLAPQQTGPLLEVDEDLRSPERLREIWSGLGPSITINLIGLPSVLVPTGLHHGLPAGVQLIAGRYREDLCLAAAEAVEGRVGALAPRLWARETGPA
jgi:amidase